MSLSSTTLDLTQLLDFLDDVVAWAKDAEGRYLWVNRAFVMHFALEHPEKKTDLKEEEFIGKTDYDFSPPFLADQFRLDDEHVLAGNRIMNRIERVGGFGGAVGWNITHKIPLADRQGKIIGTAGMTRVLDQVPMHLGSAPRFAAALEYMRDHFGRVVTNQELARVSKMSLRAFERQFLAAFHLTPQKYLRKLRLRIASRALVYSDESLSQVALGSGFSDQSHFSREFRRQFGRTPREYRAYYRAVAVVPGTKTAVLKQ